MNFLAVITQEFQKFRWNYSYRKEKWDYLKNKNEAGRYRKIIDFIEEFSFKNSRILDLGCGSGVLTERIPKELYSYFLGIDFSKESIRLANRKELPGAVFLVADIVKFKPEQVFDVIIFNEAFYYIPKNRRRKVFRTMKSHLSENGIFIVSMFQEGFECWQFFRENPELKELDFQRVTSAEERIYWKIGVFQLNHF